MPHPGWGGGDSKKGFGVSCVLTFTHEYNVYIYITYLRFTNDGARGSLLPEVYKGKWGEIFFSLTLVSLPVYFHDLPERCEEWWGIGNFYQYIFIIYLGVAQEVGGLEFFPFTPVILPVYFHDLREVC